MILTKIEQKQNSISNFLIHKQLDLAKPLPIATGKVTENPG